MAGVEIEVARAALVVGLVITALLYHRTRILSGGAVTGSYLALMILGGQWVTIIGWAVLSLVGLGAISLASRFMPLPRAWLFAIGVAVPATLHSVGVLVAGTPELGAYSAFLAAGLYVTNGLTAYDAKRQGVRRTVLGIGIVVALTLAVIYPVSLAMDRFVDGEQILSGISLDSPLVILVCIFTALAVRLGLRWGTAGIVGSLFLVDLLSLASLAVILGFTIIGTIIYSVIARRLGLTPRERLYSLLAVGAIVSWFGLFWASWLGIPGAEEAEMFAVEPLLVIGLMIGETQRYGLWRMLAGTTIVATMTWLAQTLFLANPGGALWLFVLLCVPAALLMFFANRSMVKDWKAAIIGGDQWGVPLKPPRPRRRHLR